MLADEERTVDIVVAGGALTGLWAGIRAKQLAPGKNVLIVDKATAGRSGCAAFAGGDITCVLPEDDFFLQETYARVLDMEKWGVPFEREPDGRLLRKAGRGGGALSVVMPGWQLLKKMRQAAHMHGVAFLDRTMVVGLVSDGARNAGVLALDVETGKTVLIRAGATVLVPGPCSFKSTFIGHLMVTGDGIAAAFRDGAEVVGMEFAVGHNTGPRDFDISGLARFVAMGGKFLNSLGEEFLYRYDPVLGNKANWGTLARAMAMEVKAGRGPILFDMTSINPADFELSRKILPHTFKTLDRAQLDFRKDRIEWIPCFQGNQSTGAGLRIDRSFSTTLPGVFSGGDTGHKPWYMVGGPAKMAVLASAFYGTINGSPTSNVVTTGSFTIPLMKRMGYKPHFAAAVEAAASTGGSILPPIMGTAAFLAVDVAGIPYLQIALAAAIPGVVYYLGVLLQVHYRAVVRDLRPVSGGEREKPWQVIKENLHYLVPVGVMLWLLIIRLNLTVVGLVASLVAIATSWIKLHSRMGPKQILQTITDTATSVLTVANASAAAGLVVGGIMITGLGGKFTSLLFQATGSNPLLTLVMVAIVCIILGMGMPIPAAYVLTATLAVPAMLELGFPLLPAHLFVIYFSTMSALTPPVAVAAYAGAGIAGANPNTTGFQATRLAISAYLIPFIFMYRPGLLMSGGVLEIIWSGLVAALAVWGMAGGLEGYFLGPIRSVLTRGIMMAASVVLLSPGIITDILGLGVLGMILLLQLVRARLVAKNGIHGAGVTSPEFEHRG